MKDDKISIIVPIYNSSIYLDECVNSLINQSYSNLEILLINDGSTDDSLKKCFELSKIDHRIKVINKNHSGVSETRNYGLDNATGQYIGFVDSDDYVNPNMYKNLLICLKRQNADIVECSVDIFNEPESSEIEFNSISFNKQYVFSKDDAISAFLMKRIHPACWNKLYRKDAIGLTRFFPIVRVEDYRFTWEIIQKSKKYIQIPDKLYCYRFFREQSITKSDNNSSIMNYIEFSKSVETHIDIYRKELIDEARFYNYSMCLSALSSLCFSIMKNPNSFSSYKSFTKYLLNMKNEYEMIDNKYIEQLSDK